MSNVETNLHFARWGRYLYILFLMKFTFCQADSFKRYLKYALYIKTGAQKTFTQTQNGITETNHPHNNRELQKSRKNFKV